MNAKAKTIRYYGEPWKLSGYGRFGIEWLEDKHGNDRVGGCSGMLGRIMACVNFCAGVPTESLKPNGLLDSFKPLADGSVTDVLTLSLEHERLKKENAQQQETIKMLRDQLNKLRDATSDFLTFR